MQEGRHRKHPLRTYKVSGRRQHRAAGFNTIDAPISTGIRGTFRDRPTVKRKLCAQLYCWRWLNDRLGCGDIDLLVTFSFFFLFFTCPSLVTVTFELFIRIEFFFRKEKKKRKMCETNFVWNLTRLLLRENKIRSRINLKLEAKIEFDWNFSRWISFYIWLLIVESMNGEKSNFG